MWDPILAAWKAIEYDALHRDREQDHRALSLHRAPLPDAAKLAAGRGLAFFPTRPSSRHALGARRLLPIVGAWEAQRQSRLQGILVVALEQAVAAPLATSRLADAGALASSRSSGRRGISRAATTVRRAAKAPISSGSTAARNRWSSTSKAAADLRALERIIARADVFVQNLSPRRPAPVSRPRSCGGASRASSPARSAAMAQDGPYRDMKAYDLLIQGETGLASITGSPEAPGARRSLGVRRRRRAQRLCRHPRSALRAREERRGQGAAYRDVRCDRRMDGGGAADLRGAARPSAGACRRAPSLDRASTAPSPPATARALSSASRMSANGSASARRFSARPGSRAIPRFCNNVQRTANRPALDGLIAEAFRAPDPRGGGGAA